MRIAIATVRTPFIEGGSEAHAASLRAALLRAGHEADIVTMPFRFQPEHAVRHGVEQWLNEDFTCRLGVLPPDRVVRLRFPSHYLHHPEKTLWLLRQHRSVYDEWELHAPHTPEAEELRAAIPTASPTRKPSPSVCSGSAESRPPRSTVRHRSPANSPPRIGCPASSPPAASNATCARSC